MDYESSSLGAASGTPVRRDGDLECDMCGRSLPREAAPRFARRRDDDGEIVVVCAECQGLAE
jgi:hypothetical protein